MSSSTLPVWFANSFHPASGEPADSRMGSFDIFCGVSRSSTIACNLFLWGINRAVPCQEPNSIGSFGTSLDHSGSPHAAKPNMPHDGPLCHPPSAPLPISTCARDRTITVQSKTLQEYSGSRMVVCQKQSHKRISCGN